MPGLENSSLTEEQQERYLKLEREYLEEKVKPIVDSFLSMFMEFLNKELKALKKDKDKVKYAGNLTTSLALNTGVNIYSNILLHILSSMKEYGAGAEDVEYMREKCKLNVVNSVDHICDKF